MKKFLTVLLVIAVMFTFSFGSAMATIDESSLSSAITKAEALSYAKTAYENALKSLEDDVEVKVEAVGDIDALDGGYTTAAGNYVSKTAYEKTLAEDTVNKANKAIVDAVYAKVVAAINEVANKDNFGGFIVGSSDVKTPVKGKDYYGFDLKGDTYTTDAQKVYQVTYDAVKKYDKEKDGTADFTAACIDAANFDKLAYQNEFAVKKEAALKGLAAIDLEAYSKEYKNTEKSNFDKASDDVTLAVNTINGVKITTGTAGTIEADVKKAIEAIADVYTPAAGKAKASGKLYTGGRTSKLADVTDVTLTEVTFLGLNNITKDADQSNADADLAYAKKKVLNSMLSDLAKAEEGVITKQSAIIRAERDADTPDADKIAAANNEIAKTEAAYKAAEAAIKYIVEYVDDVTVFGAFDADGFKIKQEEVSSVDTDVWSIKAGAPTTSAGFKALEIYTGAITTPANGVFKGHSDASGTVVVDVPLTVATCETIAYIVEAVNKAAENDKIFVNLDGSYAVQIEKALEDAIEDAYIYAKNTYSTPTNTSELTARKHELIDAGKVTIAGKVYADTVMDWFAEADAPTDTTYDKQLNDEIRAIVKETKDAIKAAATIADADAAFLAGYAKFDALMTANKHYNTFAVKSGALFEKYNKYRAQFTNYATAAWQTIEDLKKDSEYSVEDLNGLVNYYVGSSITDGAFYKGVYDEAALDAVYAEALAAVDGLKTKAQIKEMADAAVTAINAIADKATIADKAAVAAAWDAYYAYTDYAVDMLGLDDAFEVDATYVKAYDKLVLADKEVTKAEQKAIKAVTDLFPATAAKVTLADKDNIAKVRELVDAYVNDYVAKDAPNTNNDGSKKSYATLRNEALALTGLNYNDFCAYERALAAEQVKAVDEMIAKLAVSPVDEAAVKAAREAYDAIPENVFFDYRMDISNASYDKLVALEKVISMDEEAVKAYVQDLSIKARSTKTSKGVKVTIKADVQKLLDNGYTVEYKFYRSTKSNKGFKAMVTKTTGTYTNTKGVKGTKYYYKAKLVVKNAEGEVVATTPLTQCLYASRTF